MHEGYRFETACQHTFRMLVHLWGNLVVEKEKVLEQQNERIIG